MCFAPRYMSGTMARPSRPCRNTASLPATPCASSVAAPAAAMASVSATRTALLALILFMARITGLVNHFTDRKNPLGILFLRRRQRLARRVAQRDGMLRPVAAIDRAVRRQHHIGGFR